MSSLILDKMDVDVLVQLALHGPVEAPTWSALTDDPDQLGTALWRQNYEAAGDPDEDPPPPEYHFQPMPFGITAVEGLKMCAFYGYQTGDDPEAWAQGPARPFLERLRSRLIHVLPGWDEAPWGWSPADITARAGRGGAPSRVAEETGGEPIAEAPEDPLVRNVEEAFHAAGIPLTEAFGNPGPLSPDIDPRTRVARRELRLPRVQPVPILSVEVYVDEATARTVMRSLRATLEQNPRDRSDRLARVGRVIIHYYQYTDVGFPSHLVDGLTVLGNPDEQWTSSDPPLAVVRGTVLATRVPVTAPQHTTEGRNRVVVGHDAGSLHAVAALVADDAVRGELMTVDPTKHTVLLLVGVDSVEALERVSLHDRVPDEDDDRSTEMVITTTGATQTSATVLVVDPLPVAPNQARLDDAAVRWRVECTDN